MFNTIFKRNAHLSVHLNYFKNNFYVRYHLQIIWQLCEGSSKKFILMQISV